MVFVLNMYVLICKQVCCISKNIYGKSQETFIRFSPIKKTRKKAQSRETLRSGLQINTIGYPNKPNQIMGIKMKNKITMFRFLLLFFYTNFLLAQNYLISPHKPYTILNETKKAYTQ